MTTINRKPITKPIHLETIPLTMNFKYYLEDIIFNIFPEGAYDVILGLPWLQAHNPEISQDNEYIQFTRCDCSWEKPLDAPTALTSTNWWKWVSSIQKPLPPEKPIQIEVVNRKQMRKHLRQQ